MKSHELLEALEKEHIWVPGHSFDIPSTENGPVNERLVYNDLVRQIGTLATKIIPLRENMGVALYDKLDHWRTTARDEWEEYIYNTARETNRTPIDVRTSMDNSGLISRNLYSSIQQYIKMSENILRQAHCFTLRDFEDADLTEIRETVIAMQEMGIYRMPYPHVYLQVEAVIPEFECHTTLAYVIQDLQVYESHDSEKNPITSLAINAYMRCPQAPKMWARLNERVVKNQEDISVDVVDVENKTRFSGIRQCDTDGKLGQFLNDILNIFIVYINTRKIMKTCNEPSEKLNKKRRKNGRPELKPYTVIHLPAVYYNDPDAPGSRTHASPRLHLRRGHIRTQRYGTGLEKSKRIWIEPTLVGKDDDEVLSHEYLVGR